MVGALIALVHDEARRIWLYRWQALAAALLILCLGSALVLQMPPVYDAWGQIFIRKATPVSAAADGVSLGEDGYSSPYVIARTLLNDERLEHLVRQIDPDAGSMSKAQMAAAMVLLKRRIQLSPDQGDGFFEFHVRDSSPARAQRIAQLLIEDFVTRNTDRNQQELREAGAFLASQIASYENQLSASRARMAAFQQQHPGVGAEPVSAAPDPEAADELDSARAAYEVALTQSPGQVARPSASAEKIQALQAKLDGLRTQYTDQHPDVIAARRQLDLAIAERDADAQAAATAPPPPSNPALDAARARLAAARRRAATHRGPPPSAALQSQWAELQKADEVLRLNYQQLVARRDGARVSEAASGAEGGDKFQVTRQPTIPQFPIGPKRVLYLGLVFVASLGGGVGVAYLAAAIRGIFVSPRELEQVFQLPVVGTVSWEPAWSTAPTARPGGFAAARAAIMRPLQRLFRRRPGKRLVSRSARAS